MISDDTELYSLPVKGCIIVSLVFYASNIVLYLVATGEFLFKTSTSISVATSSMIV